MVEESKIQKLKISLRGQLLCPEDSDYDGARKVFNAMIDRRPALIDRPHIFVIGGVGWQPQQ